MQPCQVIGFCGQLVWGLVFTVLGLRAQGKYATLKFKLSVSRELCYIVPQHVKLTTSAIKRIRGYTGTRSETLQVGAHLLCVLPGCWRKERSRCPGKTPRRSALARCCLCHWLPLEFRLAHAHRQVRLQVNTLRCSLWVLGTRLFA